MSRLIIIQPIQVFSSKTGMRNIASDYFYFLTSTWHINNVLNYCARLEIASFVGLPKSINDHPMIGMLPIVIVTS